MANRRKNSYARAYFFGTDGNAALAGNPIASPRPLERRPQHAPAKRGLRAPVWAVVLVVAGVVFVLSFMLLGMRSEATQAAKTISSLKSEMARVQEINAALDLKIAEAEDPSRIHTLAVNRLGMQLPTVEQIYTVPRAAMPTRKAEKVTAEQPDGGGLLRLLLSLVGL